MNINKAHKIRVATNILESLLKTLSKKKSFKKISKSQKPQEKLLSKNNLRSPKNQNQNFKKNENFQNFEKISKKGKKKDKSSPLCFGDTIYLSFNYFNSNSQKLKKAVLYSEILSGSKIIGRCTKSENFDISISKCLFKILPKSKNIEKKPKNLNLENLIKNFQKKIKNSQNPKKPKNPEKSENPKKPEKNENYVLFGQTIILQHIHSSCFLTINPNSLSIASNSLTIALSDTETENCYIKIKPASNLNNLGGIIKYSDFFFLTKSKEENIFISPSDNKNLNNEEIAIEGSNKPFEWKIDLFLKKNEILENSGFLKFGDIVRIKHSEFDFFLSLRSKNGNFENFDENITYIFKNSENSGLKENEVLLKKKNFFFENLNFEIFFENEKNLSIFSFWEIKGINIFESENLKNDNKIRFKNIVTGQYITICEKSYKINLCDFENLNFSSIFNIKKKIGISENFENLNFEDFYKIKNLLIKKHLLISEEKNFITKKKIKKWKLEKEIYKLNFSTKISKSKKKNFLVKFGKSKNSKCLFKLEKKNKEVILIEKLITIKKFLINFYNFIFDWGVKKKENIYYIEYNLLIEQIKFLKEKFSKFSKFLKILINLEFSKNSENFKNKKKKKNFLKKKILKIGIPKILINIIELIDIRIYKSLIEIVDYSFKDQSDFGKYKKLKNYFKSNKMVNKEFSQIIGKNILDEVVKISLNYLSICFLSEKNQKIQNFEKIENFEKSENFENFENLDNLILRKYEIFVNLSFFYEEEILFFFDKMSKNLIYENEKMEKNFFLENFMKNFFFKEDDILLKIENVIFYKEIVFNIILSFNDLNDFENLKEIYLFFFENLKIKFFLDFEKKIKIQFFIENEKFDRILKNYKSFEIFEKKNSYYETDLENLKNDDNIVNKFILGYLEIISGFFKISKNFKFKKNIEKFILSIETIFEGISGNFDFCYKKIFYEIISNFFFFEKNLKKINKYLNSNSLNFYENIQKNFCYKKELPINWINSEKVKKEEISKILEKKKILDFIFFEFKKKISDFCFFIKMKKKSELGFFKNLLIFIKNGILYGIFNYKELKVIYDNILKFLYEIENDVNFEKNKIFKNFEKKSFFKKNEKKKKKIFLWIFFFFEIKFFFFKLIFLLIK